MTPLDNGRMLACMDNLIHQWKELKATPARLGHGPSRIEEELYLLRQMRNEACQHIPDEPESVSAMIINRELLVLQVRPVQQQ